MLFPCSLMFMHLYPCPLSFCESNCGLSARILHGFPLHLQDLTFPKLLTSIPVNAFTSFQISCIIKLLPVLTFKKTMENSEGSVLSRRERYPSSILYYCAPQLAMSIAKTATNANEIRFLIPLPPLLYTLICIILYSILPLRDPDLGRLTALFSALTLVWPAYDRPRSLAAA